MTSCSSGTSHAAKQDARVAAGLDAAYNPSADYGLTATPNTSLPDPAFKEQESLAYSKAGVDSGEIVIRGGSHVDFSFIPNVVQDRPLSRR